MRIREGESMATLHDIESYLMEDLPSSPTSFMTEGTGRRRVIQLLTALGNPQNEPRTVHVAGTAGKGSVTTFIAALLRAHGFRVGAYLSPHVYSVLERFQLDGRPAPVEALAAALRTVREREREVSAGAFGVVTMFEAATAGAFQLFHDEKVDYAVIETGLGGLHDATNTVERHDKLAILTTIGLDHTAVLGETPAEIALQKAGILPRDGSAVALRGDVEVDEVIVLEAARRRCELDHLSADHAADMLPADLALSVPGPHQRVNAGLAFRAVRQLARRDGWAFNPRRAAEALTSVRMPGRFERRTWRGTHLVLDGAHNAVKLRALVDAVRDQWPGRRSLWLVTMKPDKNLDAALAVIAPLASSVLATEFDAGGRNRSRGHPTAATDVARAAKRAGVENVLTELRFAEAFRYARELAGTETLVVVTGSFFAVADAAEAMS